MSSVHRADVDALVIDPAFAGTPTGDLLLATAKRYGFEAQWHPGSALALSQVPQDAPDVAEAELMRRQDRGTLRDVLQQLKDLWRILVAQGEPLP
jgi:hypothetical protein